MVRAVKHLPLPFAVLLLAACTPSGDAPPPATPAPPASSAVATAGPSVAAEEPVPALRLPSDTRPTAEAIELHIDPAQDRFSGVVDIDVQLDHPRSVIWLHGDDLNVTAASVTPDGGGPLGGTWKQRSDTGFASLTLASPVPAGEARIHIAYDAPFSRGQMGLYKATEAGVPYAFTQFEMIAARKAFPCFDEPGFKIPFMTSLVVPAQLQAIANAYEVSRVADKSSLRVSFAPTEPLPSYLVAFAVGAFDVVDAPVLPPNKVRTTPLRIRGVTAKGRGKEIAYALAHTGEILATLEAYFGIPYPYDKLDILAVPGKGGAMENPGAVTFGEGLLLMDEATASVSQRRGYASVVAHELAHQWTGDLVTMAWWDDTWLNEAFATWIGNKAAETWDPKLHTNMALLRSVQGAMNSDSLVSARSIRQPIASTHDIMNSFDSITYQKGGGVLSMFERWAGPEVWQKGVHAYLEAHRFGNGTADDFLDAENAATNKDVKTAFHTFLDQPGVPFVEASVECSAGAKPRVHLKQSRFLPLGSTGDEHQVWQIPVCVRADRDVACTLLTAPEGDLELSSATCPSFVFPNADGVGYYRFSLAPKDLASLRTKGLKTLTEREKVAYETSLRAAYQRGTTPLKDILDAARPLAEDTEPAVAEDPMAYVSQARDWLYGDPVRPDVERYARTLYAPAEGRLGWQPKKGETDETRALRASVLRFLAQTGRDTKVRAEAKKRGLAYVGAKTDGTVHADAVDANLAGVAVGVLGEEADRATWDAMKALFVKTVDEAVRARLLSAISSVKDPDLAAAARELVLDPALRDNEIITPLFAQLTSNETRETAWGWMKEHYDAIVARLPKHSGLIGTGRVFCDDAHAAEIESFFGPKAAGIEGGPRQLASTLEEVRLCVARRKAYEASAKTLFSAKH
jgi:cytosol alanyl aminopeptidase